MVVLGSPTPWIFTIIMSPLLCTPAFGGDGGKKGTKAAVRHTRLGDTGSTAHVSVACAAREHGAGFLEALHHQTVPHDGVEGSGIYVREMLAAAPRHSRSP
eukprot:1157061-Pelagomonas_calceolata.AAC.11